MAQLRGKVVLVEFWTYSCINCIHVLPHVKQWHQRYKDQGLVVVGVHTPEYGHEKILGNRAGRGEALRHRVPGRPGQRLQDLERVRQPLLAGVVPDRPDGRIVYQHFGEGDYADTEARIQQLLRKR